MAEVFMAGMPPPETIRRKATADATAAIGGSAADEDSATREQREVAERVLHSPIPGDSPADKALGATRQETLVEHVQLAQLEHNLIVHEQELLENSRPRHPDPLVIRRGWDLNNNFAVGGPGDLRILCTPIDNVREETRLVHAIQQPGDGAIADGVRQLSTFLNAVVA